MFPVQAKKFNNLSLFFSSFSNLTGQMTIESNIINLEKAAGRFVGTFNHRMDRCSIPKYVGALHLVSPNKPITLPLFLTPYIPSAPAVATFSRAAAPPLS